MTNSWPQVPLREVLTKSEEWTDINPTDTYREITVRLWGKGVTLRREANGSEIASSRRLMARAGQFILSRIDARNGAFGLVPDSLDGAVVSNDFPLFTPNPSRLLPSFLDWMSKTRPFVDICKAASEGTTNRVRLQEDRFLKMTIPLPPTPQQRRIVARIEQLAAKIREAGTMRQKAGEKTDSLTIAAARTKLSSLVCGKSELAQWLEASREGIQTGPFGAQLSRSDFRENGTPLLTIGNIQYGGLDTSDLKFVSETKASELSRYHIKSGDLLFARMGTVGRCCVVPPRASGWLINYHIIRVALDQRRVDPRFVHWTIQASREVDEYLSDKIRGATREGVNSKIMAGLPCRVPSLTEQRRIVAELDALQAQVDALKTLQAESAAELDALLPSILDKAFKGQL